MRTMFSAVLLAAAALGLGGCQTVGNDYTQDAKQTVDKTVSNARTGMVDETGNWNASGPQMSGTTAVDDKGIARTNAGVADSLVFWNGKALGMASNADMTIKKSKFYTPDGKGGQILIADIGEITRDSSGPTRASNEALGKIAEIVATITPAQLEALKAQAALGDSVAGKVLQVVAMFATGGASAAVP